MKKISGIVIFVELVIVVLAIWDHFAAPEAFRPLDFTEGLEIVVATISIGLVGVIATVTASFDQFEGKLRDAHLTVEAMASRSFLCTAVHEREFYALWAAQFASGTQNIDITHLGAHPPSSKQSVSQDGYFDNFPRAVKKSDATIRRVERITSHKLDWIQKLIDELGSNKAPRFSLAAFEDKAGDGEMPFAISVNRIDDRYGWIVAMAEQRSTQGTRDLFITSPPGVELLGTYFTERLWNQSTPLVESGIVNTRNWERLLDQYKRPQDASN